MRMTCLGGLTLLAIVGCAGAPVAPAPPAGAIAAAGGISGYQHGRAKSRFSPGDNVRRIDQFGFLKEVGSTGVFATNRANGGVLAIPNASKTSSPVTPYGMTPEEHNKFVRNYFVEAGIPEDQAAGVHIATLLEARGKVGEGKPQVHVSGYYSVLERAVDGVPVVDSFAWARVDQKGTVVSEAVYWPAISADVAREAARFKEILATPERVKAFEARLPAGLEQGQLVIRHASATISGPFEAFACFDARQGVRAPTPKLPEGVAPAVAVSGSTMIRHFDSNGVELHLPQERRDLGRDVPGNKPRPAAK